MPVEPLFTAEEFFRAAHRIELPENVDQVRAKPRASSLLDCSRQVVYSMTNTPPSNPEEDTDHRDQAFSNEDNRRTEDLVVDVIAAMGKNLAVIDRQVTIGDDQPSTGHPDGSFALALFEDGEVPVTRTINGLVYGFENKKLGRYSYLKVFKEGLMAAKPGYIVQAIVYGMALGWDVVQFCILAEDASSMRFEANQARRKPGSWAERPDWNPKGYFPVVDLRELYPLFPYLKERADAFSAAVAGGATGADVVPEYDGQVRFPCNDYCEWRDRCRQDGREFATITIPRTPLNAS